MVKCAICEKVIRVSWNLGEDDTDFCVNCMPHVNKLLRAIVKLIKDLK